MNPDQVLDQVIQANPKPAERPAPGTVLTRTALLVELDRRSGDMQTQDKPASQKTKPTSPQASPSRRRRLVPALAGAAAVMVALVFAIVLLSSESDTATSALVSVDDRPLEEQFVEAIRANDGTRIEALVDAGLDVNEDLNLSNAMTLIAATGNHELIPVVVAAGFDLEAQRFGRPPLIAAAEAGDLELISALVEAGADLEGIDATQQNTAVQYAFYFGRVEAARLLISLGADLDYVDMAGRNTADLAINGGSPEAVALAEELGLTPTSDE